MSSPLFLGLDVGTQGCKAIVYNAKENKVVSRGAYNYEILKSDVPGRAEQHPSLWIQVVNRVDYFCQLCRHMFSRSLRAAEITHINRECRISGRRSSPERSAKLGRPQISQSSEHQWPATRLRARGQVRRGMCLVAGFHCPPHRHCDACLLCE